MTKFNPQLYLGWRWRVHVSRESRRGHQHGELPFLFAQRTSRRHYCNGLQLLQVGTAAELAALLSAILDRAFKGEL